MTEAKLISALNEENLSHFSKTYVPSRLLLGPGPSNAHPEVLSALSLNPIGHLDEAYISLMSDVQKLLRYTWQCNNRLTLPMSVTGSAAMDASIANFIEEGEKILIAKKGYFGDRLVDMATRYKADVSVIEKPWGESFSYEEIKYEIETKKPAIFGIVHAETSSGVLQPLDGFGDIGGGTDFFTFFFFFIRCPVREGKDGGFIISGYLANSFNRFITIHFWHSDVDQEEIKAVITTQELQSLFAAFRHGGVHA